MGMSSASAWHEVGEERGERGESLLLVVAVDHLQVLLLLYLTSPFPVCLLSFLVLLCRPVLLHTTTTTAAAATTSSHINPNTSTSTSESRGKVVHSPFHHYCTIHVSTQCQYRAQQG
jgi:hypothetical protein